MKTAVSSPSAPAPVGAYSPAIKVTGASEMLFASGQIGLDPKSGELVSGGVAAEAEVAMKNLEATLAAGGFDLADAVQCTLYLVDMGDFPIVNDIYGRRFEGTPPSRVTVAVAALPKGARFEISAIATRS
ncbi:MAG: Rid family detoxifying hydrolase [Myxococcota bacterium]